MTNRHQTPRVGFEPGIANGPPALSKWQFQMKLAEAFRGDPRPGAMAYPLTTWVLMQIPAYILVGGGFMFLNATKTDFPWFVVLIALLTLLYALWHFTFELLLVALMLHIYVNGSLGFLLLKIPGFRSCFNAFVQGNGLTRWWE